MMDAFRAGDLESPPKVQKATPDSKTWVTKEGKQILIKDMSTEHIMNCIKMLERSGGWEDVYMEDSVTGYSLGSTEVYQALCKELYKRNPDNDQR